MRTDFLLVADAAQVADGKLYVLGGAWSHLRIAELPGAAPFAVALGVLVAWDETNVRHTVTMALEDEDGGLTFGPIEMGFEVGRPLGARPGEEQRVVLAVNGQVMFERAAGYAVVVRDGEAELSRTSFRVTTGGP